MDQLEQYRAHIKCYWNMSDHEWTTNNKTVEGEFLTVFVLIQSLHLKIKK